MRMKERERKGGRLKSDKDFYRNIIGGKKCFFVELFVQFLLICYFCTNFIVLRPC